MHGFKRYRFISFQCSKCCRYEQHVCFMPFFEAYCLPNLNTQNVRDMHRMFYGCISLKHLDLSSFNTENVTEMGLMFFKSNSLINLDLYNFNAKNVTNMCYMLSGCTSLISLDLSNFDTRNIDEMSSLFYVL